MKPVKRWSLVFALSTTLFLFAIGGGILEAAKETFVNKNCAATESCGLKNFWIISQEYVRPAAADHNRGKFFFIGYETDSLEHLKDYGIVIFKRGCRWESELTPDGIIVSSQDEDCYASWAVQSLTADPFYRQMYVQDSPRHYFYRWNTMRGSVDYKTARFYGEEKPTYPQLYVSFGSPTAFIFVGGAAQNVSFSFRMCLYKTRDIPLAATSLEDMAQVKPIHCFERSVQYVYDHTKNTFESR